MTKIGDGGIPREKYHEQFDTQSIKFLFALDQYQKEGDQELKAHLKGVMDQCLNLIRSSVKELNQPGMHKQEDLVETDYVAYIKNDTPENLSKLQEDIATLRDYNKL